MTFDLPHAGHFEQLEASRSYCDYLIVGLVTDALAVKQKRTPIMCFDQRKAILKNCKWVDLVVDHNGEPKSIAWEKLKFDILLSSDEYFESQEFIDFGKACPQIETVYIPRPLHQPVSTSKAIERITLQFEKSTRILAFGVDGPVIKQGLMPDYISKFICFGFKELDNDTTEDVYGFYKYFDKLPRNWKSPTHCTNKYPEFPMIAGVNSNREIVLNKRFAGKPWCTFVEATPVYHRDKPWSHEIKCEEEDVGDRYTNLLAFAQYVAFCRHSPVRVTQVLQRDGGITFETWCTTHCTSEKEFHAKRMEIEIIIQELKANGVVHGDIHPRNILIHPKTSQVSIIDFGWAMARCFQMCVKEKLALEKALLENFDLQHFNKSMIVCDATRRWVHQSSHEEASSSQ